MKVGEKQEEETGMIDLGEAGTGDSTTTIITIIMITVTTGQKDEKMIKDNTICLHISF